MITTTPIQNNIFNMLASDAQIERTVKSLEANNIHAIVAENGASVYAVTETGSVIIVSKTGSQLAGYVAAAAHVIWVVGTQKIVPTFEDGLKRVEEYTLPLESARLFKLYGINSSIDKLLIVNKEFMPGRTTMISPSTTHLSGRLANAASTTSGK